MIMVVGAHPDDAELMAGGALAKRPGGVIAVLTSGELGHDRKPRDVLKEERRREAEEASRILKSNLVMLGFEDSKLSPCWRAVSELASVIRRYKPALVVTHAPREYHPDHAAASAIVRRAVHVAGLRNAEVDGPPHTVKNVLLAGVGWLYLDISSVIDTKLLAIRAHKSQIEWLGDLALVAEAQNRLWGMDIGVRYAERFHPLKPVAVDGLEVLSH